MHALTHPRPATSWYATVGISIAAIVPLSMTESWVVEACLAFALAVAGAAALCDARTGRIPDRLILLAAIPTFAVVTLQPASDSGLGPLASAAAGVAAFAGPLLAVHLVSPTAMGFGDVKLAAVLGAALGSIDPRAALLALCIATAVTATIGITQRRRELPLGPGLVAGSIVAIPLTNVVIEGTVSWR